MSKVYILQKDLPELKAGEEFIKEGKLYYYPSKYPVGTSLPNNGHGITFIPEIVESNTDWFKLKDEKIKIEHLKLFDKLSGTNKDEFWYQFAATKRIDFLSAERIMRAIEFIVNTNPHKFYTEEDLRKCFNDAYIFGTKEYMKNNNPKNFVEYINSINNE